jgi:cytochrome c biogenesis protein
MAEDKRSQSLMDKVWNFFTSLKLAISVLIIMAVASIFGTVVEQNQPIEKYRQFYGDATIRMLDALNLFDMYHAWWFLLLLVLFTVNLSCCTLDRLPRVLKVVRNPKTALDGNLEKSLGLVGRWKKKGSLEAWADQYAAAMGKVVGKPVVTREGKTVHLYAERGVVSRFGVYVTHLSIIVIFIGATSGTCSDSRDSSTSSRDRRSGRLRRRAAHARWTSNSRCGATNSPSLSTRTPPGIPRSSRRNTPPT